ncbi:MAG: 50S ribosomal protein L30 [Clostridia bacterium]|nr:50S ribosomal protein L30 [Clostridia bacterium]
MKQLKITLKKSGIGKSHDQKATLKALGLRHLNQEVVHPDNGPIRGMIFKVKHLVDVEEVG